MKLLSRLLILFLTLVTICAHTASSGPPSLPLAAGTNDLYPGNRPPLLAAPLTKLPVGAVRPEGWLRRQLELMADGFSGRLTGISKWCKITGNAWTSPDGQGHSGWEEVPYWLRGYVDLAYLLNDPRMTAEARQWIDGVLVNQDSAGYFGPRRNKVQPDIWPNMVMLYALRTHYEATGDPRVIPFMQRYARWLTTVPLDKYLPDSWQKWRGGDNLDHIYWLYNQTGEPWLLELARTNHERTADWTGGIPTWHGVNLTQGFREPAEYYQQTHDPRYLQATVRNYDSVMHTYGQVPGGMFGADENARPGYTGPRQAAESCSMVEFMFSDEMLTGITGETVWADRCEEVAFNSLPAAFTADLKGLHYLTAPNMVQLDTTGKGTMFDNDGDMLSYNPWRYRCCQHNTAFGWPYFSEHLFMAGANNGLAAVLYAPCTVTAKVGGGTPVTITESTQYPFGEQVELKLTSAGAASFPLTLRIPGWCSTPRVTINGEKIKEIVRPGSWVVLARRWKSGDLVRLELPQTFAVKNWPNRTVAVQRGPLWYSLKIGERWQRNGGTDEWPAFEVFPTSPWNYALLVDPKDPARSFELVRKPGTLDPQPFTAAAAPLALRVKAKRVPAWTLESNGLIGQLPAAPVVTDPRTETVTLIPMGCARLRLSVFPFLIDN